MAVLTLNEPLDVAVPYPEIIEMAPPVFDVPSPALTVTRPPEAKAPD
jgi:hypothetical protein